MSKQFGIHPYFSILKLIILKLQFYSKVTFALKYQQKETEIVRIQDFQIEKHRYLPHFLFGVLKDTAGVNQTCPMPIAHL